MLKSLGLFWAFNRATVLGLLGCLLVAGVVVFGLGAFGRVEPVTGRITAFTVVGERRVKPVAVVEVDGRSVRVRQREGGPCRVGDRISLTRQNGLAGAKYRVAAVPDACQTPRAP